MSEQESKTYQEIKSLCEVLSREKEDLLSMINRPAVTKVFSESVYQALLTENENLKAENKLNAIELKKMALEHQGDGAWWVDQIHIRDKGITELMAALEWALSDETGKSSRQLVGETFGLKRELFAPRDAGDRRRCVGAIEKIPSALLSLKALEEKYSEWIEPAKLIRDELLSSPKHRDKS